MIFFLAALSTKAKQNPFEKLNIPERFWDYLNKAKKEWHYNEPYNNKLLRMSYYDLDGDEKPDVGEMREKYKRIGDWLIWTAPKYYWFDLNENHELEKDEIVIDKDEDTFNGNEEWYK